MIIVDIETTGLDRHKAQIVNMGAVHLETGEEFERECYHEEGNDYFDDYTTKIHGVDGEDFFNRIYDYENFSNPEKSVKDFVEWCLSKENKPTLGGHNLGGFDALILNRVWNGQMDLKWPLGYRFVDIHSLAYGVFGESLGSKDIPYRLGLDNEQDVHTGISGARHEAEIIRTLLDLIPRNQIHSLKLSQIEG